MGFQLSFDDFGVPPYQNHNQMAAPPLSQLLQLALHHRSPHPESKIHTQLISLHCKYGFKFLPRETQDELSWRQALFPEKSLPASYWPAWLSRDHHHRYAIPQRGLETILIPRRQAVFKRNQKFRIRKKLNWICFYTLGLISKFREKKFSRVIGEPSSLTHIRFT
jgi:hypothetical protein